MTCLQSALYLIKCVKCLSPIIISTTGLLTIIHYLLHTYVHAQCILYDERIIQIQSHAKEDEGVFLCVKQ